MSAFVYPLISIPYLSRIFGTDGLGQLLLAISIINVLILVVDFGFGMSALRRITLAANVHERAGIVGATLGAKSLLLAVTSVVLGSVVITVPSLRSQSGLYFLGMGLAVGAVLYPTWLLQGIGRIKTFAAIHAGSRLVALAGLLLTVRSTNDMGWAITWQFAPAALGATAAWVLLAVIKCNQLHRPSWHTATGALRESAPLFIGLVATIIIAGMNTIFLGVFSSLQQVAFYGSAERFSNALRGILGGVQQSMLPRVSASFGALDGAVLRRHVVVLLISAYGLSGVGLIVSASIVVPWYLGSGFSDVVPVAQLLGVALCVTGISTAVILMLIAQGRAIVSSRVLLIGAAFHVVVLSIGCAEYGAIGAACAVCLTEVVIASLLTWSYRVVTRPADQRIGGLVAAASLMESG